MKSLIAALTALTIVFASTAPGWSFDECVPNAGGGYSCPAGNAGGG